MKLNLSVDGKNFKNQVIDLRKKLNECQTNGVLDDGFEEQLNKLSQIEEELLAELIPYYRVYANSIKKGDGCPIEIKKTTIRWFFIWKVFTEQVDVEDHLILYGYSRETLTPF